MASRPSTETAAGVSAASRGARSATTTVSAYDPADLRRAGEGAQREGEPERGAQEPAAAAGGTGSMRKTLPVFGRILAAVAVGSKTPKSST